MRAVRSCPQHGGKALADIRERYRARFGRELRTGR